MLIFNKQTNPIRILNIFELKCWLDFTQIPDQYTGEHWHSQPKGSINGEYGGIKLVLDIESFDSSYYGEDSSGFRIAFSDIQDKPLITRESYLVPTGELLQAEVSTQF